MKQLLISLAALALCGSLAAPASASDTGLVLRVFAAGVDPDLNETVVNDDGDDIDVTAGTDLGFGASLEYQFAGVLGLELGAFWGSPKVELSAEVPDFGVLSITDELSTQITTLDLNFHLTPNSPSFDVYLGAGVAHLGYGDLFYEFDEDSELDLRIEDDLTWSAKANVDIALGSGSNWIAFGGLRYIWSGIEVTEVDDPTGSSETFDFNIFSFSVGIGISF